MYQIADYGAMIADHVRVSAFMRALGHAVKPGAVVVDIGTGTGIFAIMACRLGAHRVYAIEADNVIQLAQEIAAANGCADRIEFIQGFSADVVLPERADVVISDLAGGLPWYQRHIPSIIDARRRFLAPGGVLIPQGDVAWAAVVDIPDFYARRTRPWSDNGLGLDMKAAHGMIVNATWNTGRVMRDQMLTEPQRWATLDYAALEDADIHARVTWTVRRPGTGHGLAAGFDRTLSNGIDVSSAPDAVSAIQTVAYPTIVFPWPAPIALETGDVVIVDLDARLVRDDYVWSWKTTVLDGGRPDADKARFAQSTFFGVPLSRAALRKRAPGYTPCLTEDGRIARLVLGSMGNAAPLDDIARLVSTEFSARFPDPEDALSYVADLSERYG